MNKENPYSLYNVLDRKNINTVQIGFGNRKYSGAFGASYSVTLDNGCWPEEHIGTYKSKTKALRIVKGLRCKCHIHKGYPHIGPLGSKKNCMFFGGVFIWYIDENGVVVGTYNTHLEELITNSIYFNRLIDRKYGVLNHKYT
jgi:hypothetical protein